jgi:hypothetical protein
VKTKGVRGIEGIKAAREIEEGGSVIAPPLIPLILLLPLPPVLF